MNTKVNKIVKLAAAGLFLVALAINVKVTLEDPFVMLSEQAIATGSGTETSASDSVPGTEKSKAIKITKTEQQVYDCYIVSNPSLGTLSYGPYCTRTVIVSEIWCCTPATTQDRCLLNILC